MDITGEYRIAAARQTVWEALNDPLMLQTCIPGCENIEKLSDTEMTARITAAIGPVKARFNTSLKLENLQPPQSYALSGEAKAGATGFGRGRADVELEEAGEEATILRYRADFKVGGKLAQVGSRLVLGATRKTADEFFNNLSRELQGDATPVDAVPKTTNGASRQWLAMGAILAILLIAWFLLG